MDPSLTTSMQLLSVDDYLFLKALEGLNREALLRRPGPESNPMIWMAGHLVYARCRLARIVGLEQDLPWETLFGRESRPAGETVYPEIEEIIRRWKEATETVMPRLEALTESELTAPSPRKYPIQDKTIRGTILFLAWHESYHIGQMAYLRKWLGYGSLVG